ncbi:uncharacterized protein LOC108147836 isoform X1 [Drosophila elegans]|uniref:uncharacterized protein LOC108147836 isoform X1 n=1 Tax=Drosophila elegans TaxID=30023 RepID=UPI0007E70EA7|nr:uncharacterized protein LOC108147836 isoform X1 [Drosophila elegans]
MCCFFNIACCTRPRQENPFANPRVKRRFIWRVLLLLDVSLIVSLLPLVLFWSYPSLNLYIIEVEFFLAIPALLAFIIVQAILCFAIKIFRHKIVRISFFIVWIIVHSILISASAIWYHPLTVLVPCGTLAFVIMAMVVYSKFAPWQIGHKIPVAYLFAVGLVMIIHAILFFCFQEFLLYVLLNFVLVLVLIVVVLVDIELIVRDKTRHKFGKHEYILASMIVFRDVIWIVIIIIIVLTASRRCNCLSGGDTGDNSTVESTSKSSTVVSSSSDFSS